MPEWHQLDSSSTMPQQQESTKKKTLKSSSRLFWFSTGLYQCIQNFEFTNGPRCEKTCLQDFSPVSIITIYSSQLQIIARLLSGNRCESDCRSRGREFFPARSHTFLEIDHEIVSTVILLPSAESFMKVVCCQLQAKVCAGSTGLEVIKFEFILGLTIKSND